MIDLSELRKRCPLPQLLNQLGLGAYAKPSCRSPFRSDEHASWGIYQSGDRHYWNDFATGERGDELDLLAKYFKVDPETQFKKLLENYEFLANQTEPLEAPEITAKPRPLPDHKGFGPGTEDQISRLSSLRKIGVAGLHWAQARGVLVFGYWNNHEVYGVQDQSRRLLEFRRLDGEEFPEYESRPAHKSHTMLNSQKSWPVGILEAQQYPAIALVEGLPDFLAAHDLILQEQGPDLGAVQCAPVAMLSASGLIGKEALDHFAGKSVCIYPHVDANDAGMNAARRWELQLQSQAREVDIFGFSLLSGLAQGAVEDLNDFVRDRDALLGIDSDFKTILPG